MKSTLFLAALLLPAIALAGNKASVTLTKGGFSSSGGSGRPKVIEVKVGMRFSNDPLPVADRIGALEQKLVFYRLLEKHELDPDKAITGSFENTPLKDALAEVIPGVPVVFEDGVDAGVTVEKLDSKDAKLEAVVDFLDDAAGVFFSFSDDGLHVKAEP